MKKEGDSLNISNNLKQVKWVKRLHGSHVLTLLHRSYETADRSRENCLIELSGCWKCSISTLSNTTAPITCGY